ncbi:recombinase family protein [uncultured Clostridium sp.]|uniref:recombinase family protein n=1 Tax=uncultured Clostridium sp. TaxID=59620 RepID=UPI0025EFC1BD|nr:recombinase family protein [uncultured Clostridium sp.]
MKIAIYSRKSKFTGKGESIENQINKCRDFIQFKFETDPDNALIFIDEGFSGKNENRPQYQLMISKVKSGEIDSIVIYQLNRLGRNARDIHNTMQMCEDLNTVIYSATEGFDSSTSFGRAIIGILASLAQLEREQLAERIKDNMYTLAKMGRWLGGQSPLGFDGVREYYIDESGKERSVTQLKRNEDELKIVKAIYKKYLAEKSLSQVSKWTLANNFKGKNGGNIDKAAIDVILKNPVYVKSDTKLFEYLSHNNCEICGTPNGNGMLRYGKGNENIVSVGRHKGVIDSEDWIEVQEIMKKNTEKAPSIGKSKTALLTGILKCSCGSNMQMRYGPKRKDGTKLHYYVCTMKINSGGTRCSSKNLNGKLLEEKLMKYLQNFNINKLLEELGNSINKSHELESKISVNSIYNDIESCNKSIQNLLNSLKEAPNQSIRKIILSEIEGVEKNIADLEQKKSALLNDSSQLSLAQADILKIVSLLETFNNAYDNMNFVEKKKCLNELLSSITYDGEKLHIEFNVKKTR